jgi:hypothetical protein
MAYKGLLLAHVVELRTNFNFVWYSLVLCAVWCNALSVLVRVFLFLVLWNGNSGEGVTTNSIVSRCFLLLRLPLINLSIPINHFILVLLCHERMVYPGGSACK